jgi:site-specific DNA recombinase
MSQKRIAVGYVRVSTQRQSAEGVSIPLQIQKIRAYCELNDLELAAVYGDPGISGKCIKKRPGFLAILDMVRRKSIQHVIVLKLDRAFRSTIEALETARLMDKKGIALHSVFERLDTKSAIGGSFFSLMASLAEMERKQLSERISYAMEQKRAQGEKTGGDLPYGFTAVAKRRGEKIIKVLVPDESEQKAIARIKELKGLGYSTRKIAKTLAEDGIFNRAGHPWNHVQVAAIIKREAA